MAEYKRRYGKELFDVRYTLDKYGHRIVAVNPENPEADLLLFGCSFTFGTGLENEQTWAWKLSRDLGSRWKVTNYGMGAFGAQQMLGMLEENELEPLPETQTREALFLSIRHHLLRFTGIVFYNFSTSYRYRLVNGVLEADGYTTDSPLQLIAGLPVFMNGSQTARAISDFMTKAYFNKYYDELLVTYAAILVRSSQILAQKYKTRLTVLLWPDIEDLAPLLEKSGVKILYARSFLKSWNDKGNSYYEIVPEYEVHPNEKAADELATGIADYYKNILKTHKEDTEKNIDSYD